ncbi:LOW QUALITY PROTEIN: hypothetical protein PHMEG_00026433 [Phytophthora megakarya]|uniref:Uncharacterized protein n=1 Tax=Phytophthora megakarya TaxID=4795 RepID=A0A225V9A6_9STRA|nr:LOW QUALITY PROTEIN: hypothetical protein PHMEG_00026433 [Phytophthora megakarya]
MSLRDLAPNSTKHERESTARLFKKFVADEGVNWEYLSLCITRENAPFVFFGGQIWHVSGLQGGTRVPDLGQTLGHAVLPTGQELDGGIVPQVRQTTDKAPLMKGQVLERYCMKRESGSVVNKVPVCTKKSLKIMVMYLYSIASTAFNYQYAALLCLLWYLFGRASDLTPLRKMNLSNGAGNVFLVRFIRIKTSEELGFSLFPDNDFTTCSLLAIALSLATQSAPAASFLNQLPEQNANLQDTPTATLIGMIGHPKTGPHFKHRKTLQMGRNFYVNRVLGRVAQKIGVTERLTSHSFRRGGTQHANEAGLCVQ